MSARRSATTRARSACVAVFGVERERHDRHALLGKAEARDHVVDEAAVNDDPRNPASAKEPAPAQAVGKKADRPREVVQALAVVPEAQLLLRRRKRMHGQRPPLSSAAPEARRRGPWPRCRAHGRSRARTPRWRVAAARQRRARPAARWRSGGRPRPPAAERRRRERPRWPSRCRPTTRSRVSVGTPPRIQLVAALTISIFIGSNRASRVRRRLQRLRIQLDDPIGLRLPVVLGLHLRGSRFAETTAKLGRSREADHGRFERGRPGRRRSSPGTRTPQLASR